MHLLKPIWLTHGGRSLVPAQYAQMRLRSRLTSVLQRGRELILTYDTTGEKKDFEVYSCHVSPDGERLVTAAGGAFSPFSPVDSAIESNGNGGLTFKRRICSHLVDRRHIQCHEPSLQ